MLEGDLLKGPMAIATSAFVVWIDLWHSANIRSAIAANHSFGRKLRTFASLHVDKRMP